MKDIEVCFVFVLEKDTGSRQAPDVLEIPPPGKNGLCCIVHETDDAAALLASMHPREASRRDGRCQRGERPHLDSKQDAERWESVRPHVRTRAGKKGRTTHLQKGPFSVSFPTQLKSHFLPASTSDASMEHDRSSRP